MVPARAWPESQAQGTIDVWRIDLDDLGGIIARFGSSLSDDEQARAARFRSPRDRDRFLASHAALRAILGRYARRSASELSFVVGPHGKPSLDGRPEVEFNLSHSGDLAIVAIAQGVRVGVDVELARPIADRDAIVRRFFSPRERADFDALPEPIKPDAFYRIWTCKEAYIKAIGKGLSEPLDRFSVSADPREPARLVEIGGHAEAAARWTIRAIDVGEGYAAAVAVEAAGWTVLSLDAAGLCDPERRDHPPPYPPPQGGRGIPDTLPP